MFTSSLKSKIRQFHVVVGKNGKEFEMYKNVKCTRKAVVLSTKPIVIFDVLVAVASSDRNKEAVNVASKSVLLAADVIEFAIFGSSSNDDGDGNENGKKNNRLRLAKQQLYTCITVFCTFLCPCSTTSTRNRLVSRFTEDVNTKP